MFEICPGAPEITDQRASTGYPVWQDRRARVLIDMGPGSLQQFEHSGAGVEELDVILLTYLHVDHSADLPVLVKSSFFTARNRDLPLFGPTGNRFFPATERFFPTLFASPDPGTGLARGYRGQNRHQRRHERIL